MAVEGLGGSKQQLSNWIDLVSGQHGGCRYRLIAGTRIGLREAFINQPQRDALMHNRVLRVLHTLEGGRIVRGHGEDDVERRGG